MDDKSLNVQNQEGVDGPKRGHAYWMLRLGLQNPGFEIGSVNTGRILSLYYCLFHVTIFQIIAAVTAQD